MVHTGECQRSDGRYAYSYTDPEGTRRTVYAKSLAELRQKERKSIREYGVLHPGIARPLKRGKGYELIAGHRRKHASEQAGKETMPVLLQ